MRIYSGFQGVPLGITCVMSSDTGVAAYWPHVDCDAVQSQALASGH